MVMDLKPVVRKMLISIIVLAVLAMGATAYLTYLHYEPSASEFCNFNARFNCDVVNKSQWSYIPIGSVEIPVAILGFLYYLGVFIGCIGLLKKWSFTAIHKIFETGRVLWIMRWLTYFGVLFALYLTYIETFVLHTYCIFCLIQQFLILGIVGLFIAIRISRKKSGESKGCCC